MKPQELRVGNLLLRGVMPVEVKTIGDSFTGINEWQDMGARGSIKYEELNPIPLTEEWLVRFGFEEVDIDKNYMSKGCVVVHKTDGFLLSPFHAFAPFKYVHQLQNLYFALTGEELTIKQ